MAALTLLLLLLLTPAVVLADGAFGRPGIDIFGPGSPDFFLEHEHFALSIEGDDAGPGTSAVSFDCRFRFVNRGDSTSIRIGFPPAADPAGHLFHVRVDGASLAMPATTGRGAFLWPVSFGRGQARDVQVEYVLPWRKSNFTTYPLDVSFVLRMHSLVPDSVESRVVELVAGQEIPFISLSLEPPATEIAAGVARWEDHNVQTSCRLLIRFSPMIAERYSGRFTEPFRPAEHGLLASRECLDLVNEQWERQFRGLPEEPELVLGESQKAILVKEAQWWRAALGQLARMRPLEPLERLNFEYAQGVEAAILESTTRSEALARLAALHARFW